MEYLYLKHPVEVKTLSPILKRRVISEKEEAREVIEVTSNVENKKKGAGVRILMPEEMKVESKNRIIDEGSPDLGKKHPLIVKD